ncbi:hypothetical protein PQ456_03900 [Paenibacillus kyungheensis]|uniref:Uncharacterized protein n=1 Tax=Paenibacillus kyungheensis TaxID=1452732 RepID=A0AAX3M5F6_9BACL|nr:hypothetical protein [Paenibacillus kyungheensis]WCT56676.1 hypothetical protein PQ456_03900 [Paenibacillus kyungheensis]
MWGRKKNKQSLHKPLSEQQLWERYFFERHSLDTLLEWSKRLKYFRYCRAYGGHVGDGDSLLIAIRIQSEQELHEVFEQLDIPIVLASDSSTSTTANWRYPQIEHPKHVMIAGVKAFIWMYPDRMKLSITNLEHPVEVTATSVVAAEQLEPFLAPLAYRMIDPPQDDRYCFRAEDWR